MEKNEEYINESSNATPCNRIIDSLPEEHNEDLEEAALLHYPKMSRISEPHGVIPADNQSHYLGDANEDNRRAFKAGAEWQKQKSMQDFLEKAEMWLEPTFKSIAGYNCGGDLMNDFKNYMQNESEN